MAAAECPRFGFFKSIKLPLLLYFSNQKWQLNMKRRVKNYILFLRVRVYLFVYFVQPPKTLVLMGSSAEVIITLIFIVQCHFCCSPWKRLVTLYGTSIIQLKRRDACKPIKLMSLKYKYLTNR